MGVKDFEENMNRSEIEVCFFICGENLSIKGFIYFINLLFDYWSLENNSICVEFILDLIYYKEIYIEMVGM